MAYALLGYVFGAILAALGWWLYGAGMSGRLPGASVDPSLAHWIRWVGGAFAILGFLLKDRAASVVGDVIAALFNFEGNRDSRLSLWQVLLVLAIVAAAIWFGLQRLNETQAPKTAKTHLSLLSGTEGSYAHRRRAPELLLPKGTPIGDA